MESAPQSRCIDCAQRSDRFFCELSADALQAFDQIKSVSHYQRGTVLFRQDEIARGIFLLCQGRVKLSVISDSGKRLTLRIVGPGEVLGLSACLSGGPHEVTAEMMDDAQVAMVKRKELLLFLRQHREACLHVVHLLSQDLHIAYDRVRAVGLGRTRRVRPEPVH